ncbi:MAG: PEP-CTERM sorting domain-containing protein [Fimbriimonadaceae bacterium]|nr:PEP-CTERM sorting domain-containing protein [Fimbriimonadaceae bacterium]
MKKAFARIAVLALGATMASFATASLSPYSQNFEGLNAADGAALTNDGWLVFANVFDSSNNYLYGYGPFGAPNGGPGFSSIATGEGGPNQAQQYLNAYSDYNNGDHGLGRIIEANVFQEQVIGAGDLGMTYNFTFDYKASFQSGPAGSTTTFAFIKVLNPNNGYSLEAFPTLETTAASTTVWSEGNTISITIDNAWTDHLLQFGFLSNATNFEPSGVYYDNINFAAVPEPFSMIAFGAGLVALARKRKRN